MEESKKKKYYYYKKKRGRKKKRGPKRKIKKRGREWQETWDFKIVTAKNKIQNEYIGKYHTLAEVLQAKEKIEEINNNILFPMKYIQNGRNRNSFQEYDNEYLILKRKDEEMLTTTNQLRNKFGKLINIETNSDIWYIYDRMELLCEEHFWVYGYNPKIDRKDYKWIFNHFILEENNFIRIYVLNNKLIFKYDEDLEFIICKNVSDSIRLYNKLKENSFKQKNILFIGALKRNTYQFNDMIDLLQEKTGWNRRKLIKNSTL